MASKPTQTRVWNVFKGDSLDEERLREPLKWRRPRHGWMQPVPRVYAALAFDPFDGRMDFGALDMLFAVMASCGWMTFRVKTAHPSRMHAYMESVARRGQKAGPTYERRMRAHFKKYKNEFREGYSLPEPPTPELRALYDSAVKRERRPVNPCGFTLHSGFSGGEYHWRDWPLDNVRIKVTN